MRTTMRHLRASLTLAHPDLAGLLGAADTPPGGPPARGVDGLPDPGGEAGMATAEYAIGTLATVHVPKRTWLGVCPAAREPWYCNESTSWEVPAEPSGVL